MSAPKSADAIAYMRATVQPPRRLGVQLIVNVPRRGVGDTALRTMHEASAPGGFPCRPAAPAVENRWLKASSRSDRRMLRQFGQWQKMLEIDGHVVTWPRC